MQVLQVSSSTILYLEKNSVDLQSRKYFPTLYHGYRIVFNDTVIPLAKLFPTFESSDFHSLGTVPSLVSGPTGRLVLESLFVLDNGGCGEERGGGRSECQPSSRTSHC